MLVSQLIREAHSQKSRLKHWPPGIHPKEAESPEKSLNMDLNHSYHKLPPIQADQRELTPFRQLCGTRFNCAHVGTLMLENNSCGKIMSNESLPEDIFPQIIRRCDFRTFVKWTMTNRKWSDESFKEVHSIDSYWCFHFHTATALPHVELREMPRFLKRHIRKFDRITELSLGCRWFYAEKSITSVARSDSAWTPTLFPLISMNASRITRLELQDYDGVSYPGKPDPLDELIGQLGPQLKELALLNIWITEFTIEAISNLKCSLDVFSLEGSSFPSRFGSAERIELIEKLLAAPAVKAVRVLRLTWSITTPLASRLPNGNNFPNIEFLDLGIVLTDQSPSTVAAWEAVMEETMKKVPGIKPTQLLRKTEDLLCDAVTLSPPAVFDVAILSFLASKGFTPDLYRDIGYSETDTRRIFRTHPIVPALGSDNFVAADLLVQNGYLEHDLPNMEKMKLLVRIGAAKTAADALVRLQWIGRQSIDVIKRLLPVGMAGIPIFFSATMKERFQSVNVALSNFFTSRPDLVELLQFDVNFDFGGQVTLANYARRQSQLSS